MKSMYSKETIPQFPDTGRGVVQLFGQMGDTDNGE